MKKRIAHIAGGLTTGGVEAVIYNYFSKIDRKDYELYYITYDTPDPAVKKKFEDIGFHVYEVTKKKENLKKSCKEVYTILKENHINIVHSHMTLMSFVTSFLGKLCGIKVRIAHSHLALYPTGIKKPVYAFFKFCTRVTSTDYMACGKKAGESVSFGGLLGHAPIMPVQTVSPARFIQRGGRIPAPIHSLKN